uniref:Uncharacterized protein n=1 Tax=Pseudomonas aeruginosa TaxID=287 RepID=A6N5D6_PSEAI|nr:hypothetical protein [Pseudomonas aeruginosa]
MRQQRLGKSLTAPAIALYEPAGLLLAKFYPAILPYNKETAEALTC